MSRTVEKVYNFLYSAIASGRLRPGSHLAEEQVAEELGVSRTPVREAIRKLETDGLVVLTRNSGADVALLGDDEIAETFHLRAMLEGYAAERAATRITPDQLVALDDLAARLAETPRTGEGSAILESGRLNAAFHLAIAEAAQSGKLLALIRALVHLPLTIMHQQGWAAQLARSTGYRDHEQIIEALRQRDPILARARMQLHILNARPTRVAGSSPLTPEPTSDAPLPARSSVKV